MLQSREKILRIDLVYKTYRLARFEGIETGVLVWNSFIVRSYTNSPDLGSKRFVNIPVIGLFILFSCILIKFTEWNIILFWENWGLWVVGDVGLALVQILCELLFMSFRRFAKPVIGLCMSCVKNFWQSIFPASNGLAPLFFYKRIMITNINTLTSIS